MSGSQSVKVVETGNEILLGAIAGRVEGFAFEDRITIERLDLRKSQAPIRRYSKEQLHEIELVKRHIRDGFYLFVVRACPICSQTKFSVVATKDRYGLPLQTVLCHGCALCFANTVMREEDYRHFYGHHYRKVYGGAQYASDEFFQGQVGGGRRILQFLRQQLTFEVGTRVLEVGCGAGGVLLPFKEAGAQVIGVDYGPDFLQYGRALGLDLIDGSLEQVPEGFTPDIIIYRHVLEHVYDLQQHLSYVAERWPGVTLYINCPGLFSINIYKYNFLNYLQNAHLYNFTRHSMRQLLEKFGWRVSFCDEGIRCISSRAATDTVIEGSASEEMRHIVRYLETCEAVVGAASAARGQAAQ